MKKGTTCVAHFKNQKQHKVIFAALTEQRISASKNTSFGGQQPGNPKLTICNLENL